MKTTNAQPPVETEVLKQFTNPEHSVCANLMAIWNLRTDGTQSDADRLKLALGEEGYEHYNWDTAVTNGSIMLLIPRFKYAEAKRPPFGFHFPAEWFWCFSQIELKEDAVEALPEQIATVPTDVREQVETLPEVQWIKILRVNFFDHVGGKVTRKHRPPPEGMMFFRFKGGLGVAVAPNNS